MLKITLTIGLAAALLAVVPAGRSYLGPAVAIGNGNARTVVVAGAGNRPIAFGVEFTPGALSGLPRKPYTADRSLDWAYWLPFPTGAPATGFDHVMIDWHPMGHEPQGVYTVPHFDFHFYAIDRGTQLGIKFAHPETADMSDVSLPAKALIPSGYIIPAGTQVDEMGVHAIPASAPELHGKPFTNTLIYGYDARGTLIFIEPMITMSYLRTRPDATAAVVEPDRYSVPGYYPGRYTLTFDARTQRYEIIFGDLKPWQTSKLSCAGTC